MPEEPRLSPEIEAKLFAMRLEWQRRKDARDNLGKPQARWDRGRGMYLTDEDKYGE